MANYDDIVTNQQILDIANSIRKVTRTTDSMTILQMPERLLDIRVIETRRISVELNSPAPLLIGTYDESVKHLFIILPVTEQDAQTLNKTKPALEISTLSGEIALHYQTPTAGTINLLLIDCLLPDNEETQGTLIPQLTYLELDRLDSRIDETAANLSTLAGEVSTLDGVVNDLSSGLAQEIADREAADNALSLRTTEIEQKIPPQATVENKLADKEFVNSSITHMAARYVTPTPEATSVWASFAALNNGPWYHNGSTYTPTQHDYAIYTEEDGSQWRATYEGGQWAKQFKINDTPFTAAQIAALNSNITAALVDKLVGIEPGAQVNTVLGVKGGAESVYRQGNVNITKDDIGLGNVDNTSDMDKPVSIATQAAIAAVEEAKQDKSPIDGKRYLLKDGGLQLFEEALDFVTEQEVTTNPQWLPNTGDGFINEIKIYGKSVQDGEPTADNPVDIINTPPEFDLTVCGKNLFNINSFTSRNHVGATTTIQDNKIIGTITATSGDTAFRYFYYIPVTPLQSYTFSCDIDLAIAGYLANPPGSWAGQFRFVDKDGNYTGTTQSLICGSPENQNTHFHFTITMTAPANASKFFINLGYDTPNYHSPQVITFSNIQFEKGSETTYAPYVGNTYPCRLEDIDGNLHELCSLPDGTRDEVDLESGKIIKRTAIKVFNGTESGWIKSDKALNGFYINWRSHFSPEGAAYAPFFSNIATPTTSSSDYINFFNKGYSDDYCCISADPSIVGGTLESWKNWLAQQHANGTPVVVVYKRATPQVYDLHPDELEKLKTLPTYQGGTNLWTTTDNGVEPDIWTKEFHDSEIGKPVLLKNKDEEILNPVTTAEAVLFKDGYDLAEVTRRLEGAVAQADEKADNAVPKTRKINGKTLSADITLTPADIGAATAEQGAKADTALQIETDPTVPEWAKQATKPAYTKDEVGLGNVDNIQQATKTEFNAHNTDDIRHITAEERSSWNNKADLVGGKVPASQLPSYVDDVLIFDSITGFPTMGEDGKIYVTRDTNLTYRWNGTGYTEISPSLALGETSATAYRGDRGKIAYDHSQEIGNPHQTKFEDILEKPATLDGYGITGIDAEMITSGVFDAARIPDLSYKYAEIQHDHDNQYAAISHTHDEYITNEDLDAFFTYISTQFASSSHNHSASNITSGTLDPARLPYASSSSRGAVRISYSNGNLYIYTE